MFRKHNIWMVFVSLIVLFMGVSLAWVLVSAASIPLSTIGWQQVNESGFGKLQNIGTLDTFNGLMYAGTWADTGDVPEIWRTNNGRTWEKFSPEFNQDTGTIMDTQPFLDSLYIGTMSVGNNALGSSIWRSDGLSWEMVASDGFGDIHNLGVDSLTVYSNTLIAATATYTSGVEVWSSLTGDPGTWIQINTDGFGLGIAGQDSTMDTYNDFLYFGMGINGVATLLRTDDLITWTPVFTDGLGNSHNTNVSSMAEFNGDFYIGLRNVTEGGEVWRTSNGVDFSPVFTGGNGNIDDQRPYGLIVYQNYLYLTFSNLVTGAEVWRTSNGSTWEQVGFTGFGDPLNIHADYFDKAATIYNNSLYIGTLNNVEGGQIWQLLFSPDMITISGPTSGTRNQEYIFTGSTSPITSTLPLTYTWQATNFSPITFTGGITNTMNYAWEIPGTKVITATVENGAGAVTNTHLITILPFIEHSIFLPTVMR
jgi:hypothetical protein